MTSATQSEARLPTETEEYEFSVHQEWMIAELATSIGTNSLTSFMFAFFSLGLGGFVVHNAGGGALLAALPVSFYFCIAGYWSWKVQRELHQIADSQHRDISHLMSALRDLRRLYKLKFWAGVLAALLLFVLLLAPGAAQG